MIKVKLDTRVWTSASHEYLRLWTKSLLHTVPVKSCIRWYSCVRSLLILFVFTWWSYHRPLYSLCLFHASHLPRTAFNQVPWVPRTSNNFNHWHSFKLNSWPILFPPLASRRPLNPSLNHQADHIPYFPFVITFSEFLPYIHLSSSFKLISFQTIKISLLNSTSIKHFNHEIETDLLKLLSLQSRHNGLPYHFIFSVKSAML